MYQRATVSADLTHSREAAPAARRPERAPSHSTGHPPYSGNQSRLRCLASPQTANPVLQRKLAIGTTNDPLEIEADRTADRILRMPGQANSASPAAISNAAPLTLRRCSCGGSSDGGSCDKCKDEVELQRKRSGPTPVSEAPGIVQEVLRSSGQPLDQATRSFFEPRFGQDFSEVRIHTSARADESARQVNAFAYTVGSNVVFRTEQFAPNTARGRRLLAHELTHVVQQRRNGQSASSTLRRAEVPSAPSPDAKNAGPEPKCQPQPNRANGCYYENFKNPGKVYAFGTTRWVLSNFDVDQHYVKKEHFDFLRDVVVPKINATPAGKFLVVVVGEASTTADFAYNLDLSQWRANCVAEELVAACLDGQHRSNIVTKTGELRGDLEQISHGIDPRIGIEDWTKRMVTIFLLPAGSCTPEQRSRAANEFYVKVACSSPSEIRINIGVNDPAQPIYREFAWLHDPWPSGCKFIPGHPPDFKSHYDFVKTAVDLRLATKDPDDIDGPSDFTGPLPFFAYGANEYLARGNGIFELFKIGLGGKWKPESCGTKSQIVEGSIFPLGPVKCGWAPDPPGHCDFTDKKDKCSDDDKMAASKRFNGYMVGGSISAKELLELLKKEAPALVTEIESWIDDLPPFVGHFLDPGGLILNVQFGTKDTNLDPPLTRSFVFVGTGNQGGGSSFTDHFKGAVAPEQDATEPSQLATENPNSFWASSDLSTYFGTVVIHGASNKIELTTGAGTFNFFTPHHLCNDGGTRTYSGLFLPRGAVNCPDDIALHAPSEKGCKDEEICPKSTRTAGHKKFTVKVGRATLASLPLVGRRLADLFGCKFGAAFLNIQSEDGPKEKQIHRKFVVVFEQKTCRFTVGDAPVSISGQFSRQLAIDHPDDIFASSDFHPGAELTRDGELRLIPLSNYPLLFKLPGAFDPACKVRSRAWGLAGPTSAVQCGPAPEPDHDTRPDVNHTDDCNQFKKQHAYFVDPYINLIGGADYQDIYAQLPPGRAVIPPDEFGYYKEDYRDLGKRKISPAVFIVLAENPQGGQPIQAVAFADLWIVRVTLDGYLEVQFRTDVCAFDEFGNVVLIRPDHCLEGFYHAGDDEIIRPIPVRRPRLHLPKVPLEHRLAIGSANDPLEGEADRTADRVLRTPDQAISAPPAISAAAPPTLRRCSCGGSCDSCRQEDDQLQRKPSGPTTAAEAPPIVHETLRSSGSPLDPATREFMESRFGRDFSAVRVHTGDRAAESARQVDSLAYTVGSSIVFRSGSYNPHSIPGRRLLAHELTHVAQQNDNTSALQPNVLRRTPPSDDDKPLKPVRAPQRVPYGSTRLSKEAIRIRRTITDKTGHDNLVVVHFFWKKSGGNQLHEETVGIWNTSTVGHSEQELDQYFRDFKENRGGEIEVTVHGIFSERQFCGPSSQNCQKLIYKSYPDAIKEFAYNYQLPPGAKATKKEEKDRRNVIKTRIETFRDSEAKVDRSANRDPDPFDEASGGTVPGQVVRPQKKPKGGNGSGGAAPDTDPPASPKLAQDKPAPKKPAVDTPPPPPKPAPDTTVPKKPDFSAPTRPLPDTSPQQKPSAPKPPAPKPAPPKPSVKSAPPKPEPATTPKKAPSSPAADVSAHSGGPKLDSTAARLAKKTVSGVMNASKSKLNQFIRENSHDKDLNWALDTVDKAIDVHSFLSNPAEFAAQSIKTQAIQGVFEHFSNILSTAQQRFDNRFPDFATLHRDPLNRGISLEGYEALYNQALAALRLPSARRTLYYAFVLLGTNQNTPEQEIRRRIEIANEALENQPDLSAYVSQYKDARDSYGLAIFLVNNRERNLIVDLADQPAGLADELRRRGEALEKAGKALTDISDQIMNSPLIVIDEIFAAATEIETLGNGFKGLSSQFDEFANLTGSRKRQYQEDTEQMKTRSEKLTADRSRVF